ncbi:MAG: FAD-dependent oxidoreductase [Candidatus Nanohaloarchaea archaeon]
MAQEKEEYEVVIIGGGIVGAALLYTLSNFTDIENILLIEKEEQIAEINSHHTNNSQTLHFGDIETNYSLEKAEEVKEGAEMVTGYLEKRDPEREMHSKRSKMVLAVGEAEVEKLEERWEEGFGDLYPKLEKIRNQEIAEIEPAVVEGREEEEMLALQTPDGYIVDYGEVARSFLEDNAERAEVSLGEKVEDIERQDGKYSIETDEREIEAEVAVVSAGPQTLKFAKQMGYGGEKSMLPIAGSFFLAENGYLNGKVYTLQMKGLPFAAVHGDSDVHDQDITRFGPTAKLVPTLERGKFSTIPGFFSAFNFDLNGILSYLNVLYDRTLFSYVVKNLIYDLPMIGRLAFLPNVKKVVPKAGFFDIKRAEGYGGVRPQIVDTERRSLDLGEAKIVEDDIIFNITPSPGASTCLKNARKDTETIIEFLDGDYSFDREGFEKETLGNFPRE